MNLRLLLLPLLLVTSASFAQPNGKLKSSDVCTALLSNMRDYQAFRSQQTEAHSNAMWDLRGFRIGFSYDNPQAKTLSLDLNNKTAKDTQVEQMLSEIYGIEHMNKAQQGEDASKETIVSILKLTGKKEIEEFYQEAHEKADTIASLHDNRETKAAQVRRLAQSGIAAIAISGDLAGLHIFGSMGGILLGAGVLLSTEPFDLMAYYLKNDKRYSQFENKLNQFLSNDSAVKGDWMYDSWSYRPRQALVNEVWTKGVASEGALSAIRL